MWIRSYYYTRPNLPSHFSRNPRNHLTMLNAKRCGMPGTGFDLMSSVCVNATWYQLPHIGHKEPRAQSRGLKQNSMDAPSDSGRRLSLDIHTGRRNPRKGEKERMFCSLGRSALIDRGCMKNWGKNWKVTICVGRVQPPGCSQYLRVSLIQLLFHFSILSAPEATAWRRASGHRPAHYPSKLMLGPAHLMWRRPQPNPNPHGWRVSSLRPPDSVLIFKLSFV